MKKIKGFTLIELLIVVAIIAILAAIAVPNFLEAQVRSKVSRSKADMRTLSTALESYAVDHTAYPIDGSKTGDGPFWYIPNMITTPIAYISSAKLIDPFRSASYTDLSIDPDSTGYMVEDYKRYRYRRFNYTYSEAKAAVYDMVYGAWEVMGNGPYRSAGPFVYKTVAGQLLELTLPYDATNGTASRGNIIRCPKYGDGMGPYW